MDRYISEQELRALAEIEFAKANEFKDTPVGSRYREAGHLLMRVADMCREREKK